MPKNLQKSLQDYISKMKKPNPHFQFHSTSLPSSTNWIFSGCKHHPKTLSFAVDHHHHRNNNHHDQDDEKIDNDHNHHQHDEEIKEDSDDVAATLSDVDRFLFENFKSLYSKNDDNDNDDDDEGNKIRNTNKTINIKESSPSGGFLFDSPRLFDLPPDLCGSNRFFVTPVISSSLMEEARSSGATAITTTTTDDVAASSSTTLDNVSSSSGGNSNIHRRLDNFSSSLSDECIAILTYSSNPYDEFRRSMQEMIDARLNQGEKVDWDFMEELLFYFLNLNDKKSYKYILRAFVDQIVVLRHNSGKTPVRSRRVRIARDRRRKKKENVL